VHDYLESAAVDPYHRSNSSVMLDWRGVDAHLRTLREVKKNRKRNPSCSKARLNRLADMTAFSFAIALFTFFYHPAFVHLCF
jgi:methyl coenzyme M reductase gamma subunit